MAGLLDLQLLFHGAVVLILGLLCGIPFGAAAARALEGAARAWRVAHSGGATLGVMLVAIGATLSRLRLDDLALSTLTWSLVVSGYAFMLGMVLAAVAGTRGLRAEGPGPQLGRFRRVRRGLGRVHGRGGLDDPRGLDRVARAARLSLP